MRILTNSLSFNEKLPGEKFLGKVQMIHYWVKKQRPRTDIFTGEFLSDMYVQYFQQGRESINSRALIDYAALKKAHSSPFVKVEKALYVFSYCKDGIGITWYHYFYLNPL